MINVERRQAAADPRDDLGCESACTGCNPLSPFVSILASPSLLPYCIIYRLQWKYRYKLAIKQAEKNADQIFNEELFEYFNAKDDTAFWHAWRKKYCSSSLKTTGTLNGRQGDANVCNEFTEQFRSVFQTNTLNSDCEYEAEFSKMDFASEETNFPRIDIDLCRQCIGHWNTICLTLQEQYYR